MKKDLKPQFVLTSVYEDGSHDTPEIVPLEQAVASDTKMNRRGFFGTGLAASAALALLDSCAMPSLKWNTTSEGRPADRECGKTYAHAKDVTTLAVSDNSYMLASGGNDGALKCWNLLNQALVQSFKNYSSARQSIALNHDGSMVAFGVSESDNELRSLPDGKLIKTFAGKCFGFGKNSNHLIAGNGKYLDIHNLSEKSVRSVPVTENEDIRILSVSPNEHYIAVGTDRSGVMLLHSNGQKIKSLYGKQGRASSMVFSPDSKSLAITRRNVPSPAAPTTVILDIPDGNKLYEIEQNLDGLSFSPNGKWLFWEKPEIKALHTNSFELRSMEPANNELTMIPSPDEKFIITGGKDGSIKIWLWPNLEFLRCLMDIECSGNQSRGSTFNYTDEWGRILTYTMPCGAPLPAGAVCTCNCVPGKMETVCTCDKVCTCNRVCSCLSVGGGCSCDRVCSCLSVGGGYRCTCNKVCVCLAT